MLKCTKLNFSWVCAPDPARGAYSAPSGPLEGFKGPTSTGREGNGWRMGGERERSKGEKKGRDGERRREGAPIEMKVPLTKILNAPLGMVKLWLKIM